MSFTNTINPDGSITGSNISTSGTGVYSTNSNLTTTSLNTGGIDINDTITSFTNNNIIFGGGGSVSDGQNALQIESTQNITSLINLGSFCGGGGAGGNGGGIGGPAYGGAGGGGGGSNSFGNGGNGLNGAGTDSSGVGGGGGGGFNAIGGDSTFNSTIGGSGTLAGGGGGGGYSNGTSANNYGGGNGDGGGGGAGGGNGYGGGGGGGFGIYGVNGGYSINNLGTIQTLENKQGIGFGLGALFYQGNLPTNYNIIIQTDASYGQLFCTGWANLSPGTLANFGISSLSTLPNVSTSYEAVLLNIDNVNGLNQQNVTGTFSNNGKSYSWTLTYVPASTQNTFGNIVSISGINYISYDLTITPTSFPCFKEGSKILTDKGYKPIEQLRKGDLVKTLKHGFLPIDSIGKREIHHLGCKERIKEQLYCCSNDAFEEVFEPLIITGCHCILVDEFISEEQRTLTEEINGIIYVTNNKYRLPACVDLRASVYPEPGTYMIYHLALEHDDYYKNYGIYANGLLVETCSKRYLKELSGMELIEE